jgi:predicted house-cleaning noncanonical NTP pyrophosphatase (MazG superfamily)
MRKFLLNKLARDGIVPEMEKAGQQVESRVLEDTEFLREAGRKVLEEITEFDPEKPDAKELVDIIEASETTAQAARDFAAKMGISIEELEALQLQRRKERGGFDKRLYIESVTLENNDPWATYYASDPQRFKEVKNG